MSTPLHNSWFEEGKGVLLAGASRTWKWQDKVTKELLVVKVMVAVDDPRFASTVRREFNAIRALPQNRNLATPSIKIDARKCQITTPHMPDGNLDQFITDRIGQSFSEDEIAAFGIQMCNGLWDLHTVRKPRSEDLCAEGEPHSDNEDNEGSLRQRGLHTERDPRAGDDASAGIRYIIHCDLRPGNILVDRDHFLFKISGFGLSKTSEMSSKSDPSTRSVDNYKAPEQFDNTKKVSPLTDVYGLGATMWHMTTGCVPFPDSQNAPRDYRNTPLCPAKNHRRDLSDEMNNLLLRCTALEPQDRPSLKEIVDCCNRIVMKQPTGSAAGQPSRTDTEMVAYPSVHAREEAVTTSA